MHAGRGQARGHRARERHVRPSSAGGTEPQLVPRVDPPPSGLWHRAMAPRTPPCPTSPWSLRASAGGASCARASSTATPTAAAMALNEAGGRAAAGRPPGAASCAAASRCGCSESACAVGISRPRPPRAAGWPTGPVCATRCATAVSQVPGVREVSVKWRRAAELCSKTQVWSTTAAQCTQRAGARRRARSAGLACRRAQTGARARARARADATEDWRRGTGAGEWGPGGAAGPSAVARRHPAAASLRWRSRAACCLLPVRSPRVRQASPAAGRMGGPAWRARPAHTGQAARTTTLRGRAGQMGCSLAPRSSLQRMRVKRLPAQWTAITAQI